MPSGKRSNPLPKRAIKSRGAASVGYGRPPVEHRFPPGRSGNPKGRPRGAKNSGTIIRDLMLRKIEVRESGKVRRVSMFEAMLLRIFENALKGDPKAAGFLLKLYDQINAGDAEAPAVLPEHDQKILADFADSLLKRNGSF